MIAGVRICHSHRHEEGRPRDGLLCLRSASYSFGGGVVELGGFEVSFGFVPVVSLVLLFLWCFLCFFALVWVPVSVLVLELDVEPLACPLLWPSL